MINSKRYNVPLRRKREGKTNYKKRLKILKSGKPRLVIRIFLNSVTAQIIKYQTKGDKVIAAASSRELEKKGWKYNKSNLPAAYLTGILVGKKAVDARIKDAILDTGLNHPTKGSRIFACLKGALDAGLEVPHKKEIFPSEERIKGEHIAKFNKNSSEITKTFEEVKNNIKVK